MGEVDEHASSAAENEVFKAIVSMCSNRILHRLRLIRNSRTSGRNSIEKLLDKAEACLKYPANRNSLKFNSVEPTLVSSFLKAARDVVKSVDAWRKHQVLTQLEALVESVYRLHRSGTVEKLLDGILSKAMDPSMKQSLANMVKKVARYREAARLLVRLARDFPLIRQAKVDKVSLPADMFEKPSVENNYSASLPATLQQLGQKYCQKNISDISRLLFAKGENLDSQFVRQTRQSLERAKIHAEIQLIIYCDHYMSQQFRPPRVVSSSKDACYLCNLFIATHGKVHTPRCHGRLYPGWRLPVHPELEELQGVFIKRLENQLRKSLDKLLKDQRKVIHPRPNESTLLTLSPSLLTLRSGLLSRSGTQLVLSGNNEDKAINEVAPIPAPSSIKSFPTTARAENPSSVHATFKTVGTSTDMIPVDAHEQANDVISHRSTPKEMTREPSPQFQELPSRYRRTLQINMPGILELEFEGPDWSKGKAPANQSYYSLPLDTVEWLTAEQAVSERQCHARCIVNAETIEGEVTHALCSQNNLCIIVRGHALRLKFQ